jgi:hypothetical protein
MTELEKIAYAKSFIDKLANGVNPIDDTVIPDGDVVNNVRLSRCFFYVSDILRQVIANGGVAPAPQVKIVEKKIKKQPYYLLPEQAKLFEYSNVPITATEIFNRIMVIGPQEGVKKLPKKNLTKWLISLGFLEEVMVNEARVKRPTESGKEIGILQEERRGQYGNYFVVLYNRDAQQFIIDNIEAMLAFDEEKYKSKSVPEYGEPLDGEQDKAVNLQIENEINDTSKPKATCQSCRFARSGECFPQSEICADYEKAFDVPRDERAAWPEMGDASYLRQKGRRR